MEPSSSQNSQSSVSHPQPKTSPESEIPSEGSNPIDESLKSNEITQKVKSSEIIVTPDNETLPGCYTVESNGMKSQNDKSRTTLTNKIIDEEEINGSNAALDNPPLASSDFGDTYVITSEKEINKEKKFNLQKLQELSHKLSILFSFFASKKPRQPFQGQQQERLPPAVPRPTQSTPPERSNTTNENAASQQQQQQPQPQQQQQNNAQTRQNNALFFLDGQVARIINNAGSWAPYPSVIPDRHSSTLAHLLDADILFVIQQYDIFELVTDDTVTNYYIVLNKYGERLYYVYESSEYCSRRCCGSRRGLQLHLLDLYQNEVIFMNKLYGCTYFFCCYPVLEVYSPPTVPLGAIAKQRTGCTDAFVIIDPDENVLFTIGEGRAGLSPFTGADITIHALDVNRTVVGLIRREYIASPSIYAPDTDYYGISFPKNMDSRLKALFLGALFLISLKRTGWVLRHIEDPETISGHMYRMSIMTFLIPDSSGVDKTKCMKLSLVHDLAECIVGDLTPYCGVDANEKHRQEEVAMKELTKMIGDSGAEIYTLYKEYEAQVTDESKFVKDLDRLDMILQAFEYEKLGDKPGKLEEFFKSTYNKFHFPWTIDIVREIYKQRNLHINKDKSLGKDP